MIANELENTAAQYLANAYGTTADMAANPIVIEREDGPLNIYRGEGNTSIELPAVIVSCDASTQEDDSPNWNCVLNVMVRVQADPGDDNPDPRVRIEALSRIMFDAMLVTDIHSRINAFATDDFSAIAFTTQNQSKAPRERILEHTLFNNVYCANVNLL
jgi:hypothetical protein